MKANGALKLYYPHRDFADLADTCSLDVADRGPAKLDDIGARLNIVFERVRQIARDARDKVERAARRAGMDEE